MRNLFESQEAGKSAGFDCFVVPHTGVILEGSLSSLVKRPRVGPLATEELDVGEFGGPLPKATQGYLKINFVEQSIRAKLKLYNLYNLTDSSYQILVLHSFHIAISRSNGFPPSPPILQVEFHWTLCESQAYLTVLLR